MSAVGQMGFIFGCGLLQVIVAGCATFYMVGSEKYSGPASALYLAPVILFFNGVDTMHKSIRRC